MKIKLDYEDLSNLKTGDMIYMENKARPYRGYSIVLEIDNRSRTISIIDFTFLEKTSLGFMNKIAQESIFIDDYGENRRFLIWKLGARDKK